MIIPLLGYGTEPKLPPKNRIEPKREKPRIGGWYYCPLVTLMQLLGRITGLGGQVWLVELVSYWFLTAHQLNKAISARHTVSM